jgi:pilus assembly protein CpaC
MPTSMTRSRWLGTALTVISVWYGAAGCAEAQSPALPAAQSVAEGVKPGEQIFQVLTPTSKLSLVELQTRVVELQRRIKVVDGFNPDVLSITALDPQRIRLRAERPGVTSVTLTDETGAAYTLEVFVEGDIRELQAYLEKFFPGSAVQATKLRENVVLRGWVTEPDQIPLMIEIARNFAPAIHNQLRVAGENLVQLNVRVMEVQRSRLRQLGFNWILNGQDYYVASTPGALVPVTEVELPFGGPPGVTLSQAALANTSLQFAITGASEIFAGFLEAAQRNALLKILAEPVLVTTSGRPATILSGGEFPIPVPQGLGTATIEFREFGVRMEAVPIVLGNGRLRLDIAPEVSERDFSNAAEINGVVVPGLTTRRVNTQVEMRFGDTLMIGGLISRRKNGSLTKIPFLGTIPVLGAAFSRKQFEEAETELLIMVTPHLVTPMTPGQLPCNGPGQNSSDPTDHELYWDGMLEVDKVGEMYDQGMFCPPGGPIGPGVGPAVVPHAEPLATPPMVAPPPPPDAAKSAPRARPIVPAGGTQKAAPNSSWGYRTTGEQAGTQPSTRSSTPPGLIEPRPGQIQPPALPAPPAR